MCIIDEAAYVDPNLFYKVVVPILQMRQTALLALSSPEGSQNYFSRLLTLKDNNGHDFFRVKNCNLICEECRKLDKEDQVKCNHVKPQTPWLSESKKDRMKLLYATDPATSIRELYGMVEDDFIPCFDKNDIHRFFSRPAYDTRSTPEYIFVTVDPSGGGMSQLAICSGFYDEALNFVVSEDPSCTLSRPTCENLVPVVSCWSC